MQWISATTDAGEASASIGAMARILDARMSYLSKVIPPDGGLRKNDLLAALEPDTLGEPLTPPGDHPFANVLDLVSPSGMAISVQTGRAKSNNEAILAVLAGASHPHVRWVALVLPDRYKGSSTAPSVERDVRSLVTSVGVTLDLTGILVLVYEGSALRRTDSDRRTTLDVGRGPASGAHTAAFQETGGQTRTTSEPGEVEARRKRLMADTIPAGTPQSQVSPLVRVCEALGLKLVAPEAAWPGYGKVVDLDEERSIYINRTNADVRSSPSEIAAWQKAGLGTVRPDNDRYLRVKLAAFAPDNRSARADVTPGLRHEPRTLRPLNPDSPAWKQASLILASDSFKLQRERAGRAALRDDIVHGVLAQLLSCDGRVTSSELSVVPGLEGRAFDPTFASLRRSLNVDGYEVLTLDSDLTTVRLDYGLLRDQFGVNLT
ncbi:hypothetical protein HP550_14450 [Cellulomonas humilata]|uniref:Alkaline phosphatase-like protein PglZ C-terminal domain-containing protein n=1 Tax=Cellulomonas humilata TaxID=144055 RepID=A0A7Y6A4U1_9CELL|nr:hypothetical protein [Cellulomonas humilata]NUU18454.1 hypothetical protein [Cellulomonas humilata]